MTEKLLQYLWNFKIFTGFDFKDIEGNPIEIIDFGKWNHDSGPDFLLAKIKTKNLIFVGNIELHLKSSDWVFHRHSSDSAYENIILHVVFENDSDIEELRKKNIPTLKLKNYINAEIIHKYNSFQKESRFIPCEKNFHYSKIPLNFHEENVLKKLDEKAGEIEEKLSKFKNDYEAVLFHLLAYAFGLKVNAAIFREMAEHLDFSTVRKICQNQTQLEALFFGKADWLEHPEDEHTKIWKREFEFLKNKYPISEQKFSPKFLRLRPPNFPTIRLSQLANLYSREQNLFSKIINAKTSPELFAIFEGIKASEYWDTHFSFGKISPVNQEKILTEDFAELIILNAILPLKYAYHKNFNEEIADEILEFYKTLNPEKNMIISQWKTLGTDVKSALESQSLIHHFKNFCETKKCLNCGVGLRILRK
ncbi:MAG: DUF2851 family protein [Flavobacteriaceae bacterium]|jgi:hypothetical protein|nr:DUF2851 family protein [Flavobacteriaceae bacterium]